MSISSGFNKLISPLNFERLSADNDICCDLGPDAVGRGHQPPRVDERGAAVGGGADQPWDIAWGHVMCHVINNQPITAIFIRVLAIAIIELSTNLREFLKGLLLVEKSYCYYRLH